MPVSRNVRKNNKKKPFKRSPASRLANPHIARPVSVTDWKSLTQYYNFLAGYARHAGTILQYARNPDLCKALPDLPLATRLMTALGRDLQLYVDSLNALYERHADRTGDSTDDDALIEMIDVAERYDMWMESYNVVVMPIVRQLAEQFDLARTAVLEASRAQPAAAATADEAPATPETPETGDTPDVQ